MIDAALFHLGCYTAGDGGAGEGITLARCDPRTGALSALGVAGAARSPSFLAYHPHLPVLYAASELDDGEVGAWVVSPAGRLSPLGSQPTGGGHPCHLAVSPDGRYLASANYGTGSVAVHPLDRTGTPGRRSDLAVHHVAGEPGHDPRRQGSAHAHMVSWLDSGRLLAVDLGADTVFQYGVDSGRLRASAHLLRTPPGTGPRALARGPGGWLYLAGELDGSVTAYQMAAGSGTVWERAQLPASAHGGPVQPSEIAVGADGRFLYLANRGPDTIAVFALVAGVPRYLAEVPCGGAWPRHFALRDGFMYVANERSHGVATLRMEPSTGIPELTGAVLETPSPTCVASPSAVAL